MANKKKYTKEFLTDIAARSCSISDVIRKCGCEPSGGMHRHIKAHLILYEIDISHFTGRLWNKGGTVRSKIADEDIFTNTKFVRRITVRRRFLKRSIYECSICLNDGAWKEQPLTLHLDHINGDNTDNRIENLQWLCPNCHQQTTTWGNGSNKIQYAGTKPKICKMPRIRYPKSQKISKPRPTKIIWPDIELLHNMVLEGGFKKTGTSLGVSDNAVKVHLRKFGITLPKHNTQNTLFKKWYDEDANT